MNGLLLVDKPEGVTSAGVVRIVKKSLGVQKIGHLGTLDPFTSGLLPLCLGTGTKIAQLLLAERKAYTGTIKLGIETDTLDATGTVTRTAPVPPYELTVLREVKDPRVSGVTLTAATVSPDLRLAKIFFATHSVKEQAEALAGLQSAAGYIRRQLAGRLGLRHTPELHFVYDTTLDTAAHLESLFRQAQEKIVKEP